MSVIYVDHHGREPVVRVTIDYLQTGDTEVSEVSVGAFLTIAPECDLNVASVPGSKSATVTITPRARPEPDEVVPPIPTRRRRAWWKG